MIQGEHNVLELSVLDMVANQFHHHYMYDITFDPVIKDAMCLG